MCSPTKTVMLLLSALVWSGKENIFLLCSFSSLNLEKFPPKINQLFGVVFSKLFLLNMYLKQLKSGTTSSWLLFVIHISFENSFSAFKVWQSKMNNAKLYHKSNPLQKRDAQDIVNEFSHLLNHKSVRSDSTLLDIGCGSGDVLVELVLPKLHKNYTEVIGVDISPEMVKYASEKYRSQFLKFFKVDIQSDFLTTKIIKRPLRPESVDFITSFYCLHWIENQRWILSFSRWNFSTNIFPSPATDKPSQISTIYSNRMGRAC